MPDLLELDHLTVSGDVTFGNRVSLKVPLLISAYYGWARAATGQMVRLRRSKHLGGPDDAGRGRTIWPEAAGPSG